MDGCDPVSDVKMCPCGKPLHYTDAKIRELVESQIAEMGECIQTTHVSTGRKFMVPRHFIALHGLLGRNLPETARRYGFEEIH